MKRQTGFILGLFLLAGCAAVPTVETPSPSPAVTPQTTPTVQPAGLPAQSQDPAEQTPRLQLQLDEATLIAQLADTEAAQALIQLLEAGPLDIAVSDHGGFEKVSRLPEALPQNDAQITAVCGDILLYQGNSIVFFYGENTWDYTRLARIEEVDSSELESILSSSIDQITLTLAE